MSAVAPTMQAFFTERLARQRQASPRTIAAYRDGLRLLLNFVQQHHGIAPSTLDWDDLDAPVIAAFLDHLERDRHNSARTRNARLTAIRSLFTYAALRHPEHAATIQQVLAIPPKRFDKATVAFLTATEVDALLAAPDRASWEGRRDHALLLLAVQTGLRVSELTGSTAGTSPSRPARTSAATARAASSAPSPSPKPPPQCCRCGFGNEVAGPTIRCSPSGPGGGSATMRSSDASPSTPPPRLNDARRYTPSS